MLEITTILEACETAPTRRAYRRQLELLEAFLDGNLPDYGSVMAYRAHLQERGLSPQNINQALAAVRFWAVGALGREWIKPEVKAGIFAVKNLKIKGRKLGHWLTVDEAQSLINKPPLTAIGQRDRAMLALLIGVVDAWVSGPLFGARDISRAWEGVKRAACVTGLRWHDLRHAFVSRAILAGVPLTLALQASGHSHNSGEWLRYSNLTATHLNGLLRSHGDRTADEVRGFARDVLLGLRDALGYSEIERLLE